MNILPVLAVLLVMGVMYTQRQHLKLKLAAIGPVEGDEDIKIAGEHFSVPREDIGELAAQDFLKQKDSGNIEKARGLGLRYAQAILYPEQGPLVDEMEGRSPLFHHHQYILYSYAVNHVIADFSPNSILAQTSLNLFYAQLEEKSPELYMHVSDTAAFSLYILCERSKTRSDDDIGRTFASLVGKEDDNTVIIYANRLYSKLYHFCVEQINAVQYSEV